MYAIYEDMSKLFAGLSLLSSAGILVGCSLLVRSSLLAALYRSGNPPVNQSGRRLQNINFKRCQSSNKIKGTYQTVSNFLDI